MAEDLALSMAAGMKSSSQINPVDDLYTNMIEQTYFKSPYVSDSYMAPYNPDEIFQKTWDYSTYEKMVNDDQVNVCLRLKKDLILGSGYNITAGDSGQEELSEFITNALNKEYNGFFIDDLDEILTAYDFGFSITEKIFKLNDEGSLVLDQLKTRHPNTWLLHQDDHGNILKYEQRTANGNLDVNPKALIHYKNDSKFQNQYGTSDLRAAYNAWITKTHIVRFFSIFLEKAASPIPVARYDKNAPKTAVDKLFEIIKRFQTKTAITIPKDVEIEFLEAKNNGDVYHKAIHLFNMIIGRALFVPDLVGFTGSETGGGSLALGKEQMNLFFLHIERRRFALEQVIQKEIIDPIIQYNFGFVENPPLFKFKPIDENKALELAKVWLDAIKGSAYQANPEEINHFRKMVKFPEGDVTFKQQAPQMYTGAQGQQENKDDESEEKEEVIEELKEEDKKEFAYDQTPGDYSKKVNFKQMKTKLDDYDNSVVNDSKKVIKKMIADLYDQIDKKKIVQNQNTEKIDTLSLKYKKELNHILKTSFIDLYKDAGKQAQTEVEKSTFAKPITDEVFRDVIENETFQFIGDYEYGILKKTRIELIAAIKDGRPLSSVYSILDDTLGEMSAVQIERFARTKHTEVMNNARREYFDSTGVVTGYQYSAILDDRTSDVCSALHGKIFKADEAPTPPLHFNCRSALIPLTKYEEFTPTKSIRGMSPKDFIDENKGSGFAYYKKEIEEPKEEIEIDIDHPEVEFVTEKHNDENITTYSYKGKEFYRIITKNDSDGNVISLKRERISAKAKV
jgi:SPP1 gp7 family putative phage head morphogenesis protein